MEAYRSRLQALWRDLGNAVRTLVNEIAAARVLANQPRLSLHVGPASIEVLTQEQALTVPGRPREAVKAVVQRLGTAQGQECAIMLGRDLAVVNQLILPAETPEILDAIVRNKVESIAPWPLAQSLYGLRSAPVPGDPLHVAVDVGVVSRALFEEIAGELSRAGVSVASVSLQLDAAESLAINAGWTQERSDALRRATRLAASFAAFAALAAGVGLFLAWQTATRLASDSEEVSALMAQLQPARSGPAATMLEAANLLHERRRERPPAAAVLDELSALLPANVWLTSLSLDDLRIELKGQGSDIPPLIEILEQSGAFRDVNFTSATQRDTDRASEAFSIGATLQPAGQAGQP
jgi:general secretion pathway protein L